ncbi:MAG: S8 family peptidase [Firmicutes bacterium]|nr:S8 family peptidase [Bacillota bacterium]
MAVTADNSEMGRPTSWSGALDRIIAGIDDETPKLIVVAAGNTDIESNISYPENLIESSVQDPGQSWNALTVGSYTQLTQITDQTYKNYKPVAGVGELSPFSTTSRSWDKKWPIKPDIVMEGGNLAISEDKRPEECDDLSLVSTYFKPEKTLFWPFGMTSSSSALASHFAAQIQIEHPEYWPETIRALMVNSARWPDNLKNQFVNKENKTEFGKLLRTCGYGVPVLKDALYSSNNSLTLISQAEIQPFEKKGSATKTKDLHLYELPWPKEILYGLQNLDVEMKVTLSYFIEPGPGEIGWNNRYRYPSHQLRFDIKTPFESKDEFLKKVSKAQREEGEVIDSKSTTSEFWTLGIKNQNKGSLHSDIWKCTAAQLAECCYLAVFPVTGWWKERDYLGKANTKTRYSLVLTIKTPIQEIDIYTPIIQKIGITIPI